jgi:hypothetical protein
MWPETWDAWKILYPLGLLRCRLPAQILQHASKTFTSHWHPVPWLTHHWKHRVGITAADLDTMDSVGPGVCMVCGDMWASNGHNEGLRI